MTAPELATSERLESDPGDRMLRGRTIVVLSPQAWGTMRVSKHHYAAALAKRGNRVVFVSPPSGELPVACRLQEASDAPGVLLLEQRPWAPHQVRFHCPLLYNALTRRRVRRLRRLIGRPIDVLWCFDPNSYADLSWFGSAVVIFHPVDQVFTQRQMNLAAGAHLVLAPAREILDRFDGVEVPRQLIGHGLAECFAAHATRRLDQLEYTPGRPLQAGYVGNMLMPALDRSTLRRIVADNLNVHFNFWGPRSPAESNLGGGMPEQVLDLLQFLEVQPNVTLHGAVSPEQLSASMQVMDLFLVCYHPQDDPNAGANSHKILEYLSTGRVVVSSRITAYNQHRDIMRMPGHGTALAETFADTVSNMREYNAPELQRQRIRHALESTYERQLDRIGEILAASPMTHGHGRSTEHRASTRFGTSSTPNV